MADERGLDRRAPSDYPFAEAASGQAQVSRSPITPVLSPRPASARNVGAGLRMVQQMAQFGSVQLAEMAATRQAQEAVDGQVAFSQGRAMDELEAEGASQHTVMGFSTMDAQTAASEIYEQQLSLIETRDYELTPDQYRDELGSRLKQSLAGRDPFTAGLLSSLAAKQMPELARVQTRMHQDGLERKTFQSLATAVSVVSRDPSSHDTLAFMASGVEGSPSATMSTERRTAAIAEGLRKAFAEDNGIAFAVLDQRGVLDKLDLTADQTNSINAAQSAFEGRTRSKFDAAYTNVVRTTSRDLEAGRISMQTAVERIAAANGERGWQLKNADVGGLYAIDDRRIAKAQAARAAAIKKAQSAAQAQTDMAGYLRMKLEHADLDHKLSKQEITPEEYMQQTLGAFGKYNQKLTKSGINGVVREIEQLQTELDTRAEQDAKDAAKAESEEAEESAKREEAASEINYSRLMVQPNIDFKSGNITPAEYVALHKSATEQSGVDTKVSREGAIDTAVISSVVAQEKENNKRRAEDNVIREALATDNIGSLSPAMQQRVFDVKRAELASELSDLASNPDTAEEAERVFQDTMVDFSVEAGVVDARMKQRMNSALAFNPLLPDGKANPRAVAALDHWIALRQRSPELADKYLSSDSAPLAQMALDQMDSGNSQAEALQYAASALQNGDADRAMAQLGTPEVDSAIAEASERFIADQDTGGVLGALFDPRSEVSAQLNQLSGESERALGQRAALHGAIRSEAAALLVRTPGLNVDAAVKLAGRAINGRAAVMGGDIVLLPKGQNMSELIFGERAADFAGEGIPTQALMSYLRQAGGLEEMWGEDFNATSLASIARDWEGSEVFGVQLGTIDQSIKAAGEVVLEQIRGVPQITVQTGPWSRGANPGVMVRYRKPNGEWSSDGRLVLFRDMGDLFIADQKAGHSDRVDEDHAKALRRSQAIIDRGASSDSGRNRSQFETE